MSERSYSDSIAPVRDLRPSEDLSLLHSYELRRVFEAETVSSLGLVERLEPVAAESFRPISAPLASESREPAPVTRREPVQHHLADRAEQAERTEKPEVNRRLEAARVQETEVPRRDWLLDPEPIAPSAEAQPYGDDPARIGELVQWFVDGRAASASVLVPRAAGDLVSDVSESQERPSRYRTVAVGGRTV